VSDIPGWNSRLDELQAAVLNAKLKFLDADTAKRVRLASIYSNGLKGLGLTLPETRAGAAHVYHLFVIRTAQRDALQNYLTEKGIHSLVHYPVPIHQQPAYKGRVKSSGNLSETEKASKEILSLPLYPELPESDVKSVIETVRSFLKVSVA
jgi:dTDP-4-amino-4,6-dideoxygalactose transaminase